jgi:hypothetical protein
MPAISVFRRLHPEFNEISDDELVLSGAKHGVDLFPDSMLEDDQLPEAPTRGIINDIGVTAKQAFLDVPLAAIGLLDMPTGGRVGKSIDTLLNNNGYNTIAQKQEQLQSELSPQQQAAFNSVQQASGVGNTLGAIVENPSVVPLTALRSIPSMFAGGLLGKAAGFSNPLVRGSIGDVLLTAGQNEEQIRQQTPDHLTTAKQGALAALSGLGTGVISGISGGIANQIGASDVLQLFAGGRGGSASIGHRIVGGVLTEAGEEAAQSAQEQALTNLALDKPMSQGVGNAAVLGAATGGLLGGFSGIVPQSNRLPSTGDPLADELNNAGAQSQAQGDDPLSHTINEANNFNPAPEVNPSAFNPAPGNDLLNQVMGQQAQTNTPINDPTLDLLNYTNQQMRSHLFTQPTDGDINVQQDNAVNIAGSIPNSAEYNNQSYPLDGYTNPADLQESQVTPNDPQAQYQNIATNDLTEDTSVSQQDLINSPDTKDIIQTSGASAFSPTHIDPLDNEQYQKIGEDYFTKGQIEANDLSKPWSFESDYPLTEIKQNNAEPNTGIVATERKVEQIDNAIGQENTVTARENQEIAGRNDSISTPVIDTRAQSENESEYQFESNVIAPKHTDIDGAIVTSKGLPFATENQATNALKVRKGIDASTHSVITVDGGFAIAPTSKIKSIEIDNAANQAATSIANDLPQPSQTQKEDSHNIKDGVVGGMYAEGEVIKTASGRLTTPFPVFTQKSGINKGKKNNSHKENVTKWLIDNAYLEAVSRGDNFNARQFESAKNIPTQSDKDSAEEYLFGTQPDVIKTTESKESTLNDKQPLLDANVTEDNFGNIAQDTESKGNNQDDLSIKASASQAQNEVYNKELALSTTNESKIDQIAEIEKNPHIIKKLKVTYDDGNGKQVKVPMKDAIEDVKEYRALISQLEAFVKCVGIK